jgi:hypothetical protein
VKEMENYLMFSDITGSMGFKDFIPSSSFSGGAGAPFRDLVARNGNAWAQAITTEPAEVFHDALAAPAATMITAWNVVGSRKVKVRRPSFEPITMLSAATERYSTQGQRDANAAPLSSLFHYSAFWVRRELDPVLRTPPIAALHRWVMGTDSPVGHPVFVVTLQHFVAEWTAGTFATPIPTRLYVALDCSSVDWTAAWWPDILTLFAPGTLQAYNTLYVIDTSNTAAAALAGFTVGHVFGSCSPSVWTVVNDSFWIEDIKLAMFWWSAPITARSAASAVPDVYEVRMWEYDVTDHIISIFTKPPNHLLGPTVVNVIPGAPQGPVLPNLGDRFFAVWTAIVCCRILKNAMAWECFRAYGYDLLGFEAADVPGVSPLGTRRDNQSRIFNMIVPGARCVNPQDGNPVNDPILFWIPYELQQLFGSSVKVGFEGNAVVSRRSRGIRKGVRPPSFTWNVFNATSYERIDGLTMTRVAATWAGWNQSLPYCVRTWLSPTHAGAFVDTASELLQPGGYDKSQEFMLPPFRPVQ